MVVGAALVLLLNGDPTMRKLNDLHSILLATAAGRDDGSLYPVRESIAEAGARLTKAVASLSKAGLAEERETSDNAATCRVDGDLRYGLFITAAGLTMIDAGDAVPLSSCRLGNSSPSPRPARRLRCPARRRRNAGGADRGYRLAAAHHPRGADWLAQKWPCR